MPVNTGSPGTLSYAQLKGVWLDASQGTRYHTNAWASLMAAIAWAESRGDPTIINPNDNNGTQTSWGLWQISNGTHSAPGANWADPVGNAKLAIEKLDTPEGLRNWGTYNTGAYKPFVSDKTSPDLSLSGVGGGLSAAQQAQVTASAEGQKSCAWSIGWGGIPDTSWLQRLFGGGGNIGSGEVCLLSKTQARHFIGVGLVVAGGLLMIVGVNWVIRTAVSAELAAKVAPIVSFLGPEGAAAGAAIRGTAPKPKATAPQPTKQDVTTAS